MIHGTYAYRFSGFAVDMAIPSYVIGVGTMTLDESGNIGGYHRASSTQLAGGGSIMDRAEFKLEGKLTPAEQPYGPQDLHAEITFTMIASHGGAPKQQVLLGQFHFIAAGGEKDPGERFWFISAGAEHQTTKVPADEVITGEGVRIGPAPPASA